MHWRWVPRGHVSFARGLEIVRVSVWSQRRMLCIWVSDELWSICFSAESLWTDKHNLKTKMGIRLRICGDLEFSFLWGNLVFCGEGMIWNKMLGKAAFTFSNFPLALLSYYFSKAVFAWSEFNFYIGLTENFVLDTQQVLKVTICPKGQMFCVSQRQAGVSKSKRC